MLFRSKFCLILKNFYKNLHLFVRICYNYCMQNNKVYTIKEIKAILKEHNEFFENNYSVKNFLLFGSYAKNQQTPESDIDLLVNFKQPIDFFEFIDLQDYIANLFNKKIDLGTIGSLKEFVKDKILGEAIVL